MPLWKFRSLEEMNAFTRDSGGDSASRLKALIAMASGVVPSTNKRGVQKFRTIEEANEARLLCEIERAKSLKEKKSAGDS